MGLYQTGDWDCEAWCCTYPGKVSPFRSLMQVWLPTCLLSHKPSPPSWPGCRLPPGPPRLLPKQHGLSAWWAPLECLRSSSGLSSIIQQAVWQLAAPPGRCLPLPVSEWLCMHNQGGRETIRTGSSTGSPSSGNAGKWSKEAAWRYTKNASVWLTQSEKVNSPHTQLIYNTCLKSFTLVLCFLTMRL